MAYTGSRWPKVAAVTIVVGIVGSLAAAYHWHFLKERYFNSVAASCADSQGLDRIPWQVVPSFDGTTERFAASNAADEAVVACIGRWAGIIMTDRVSTELSRPAIEFSTTGEHIAINPPQRYVYYSYIRPFD